MLKRSPWAHAKREECLLSKVPEGPRVSSMCWKWEEETVKLLQVRNGQLGGGWGFRGLANGVWRCKMEKCGLGNMVVARTGSRAANIPLQQEAKKDHWDAVSLTPGPPCCPAGPGDLTPAISGQHQSVVHFSNHTGVQAWWLMRKLNSPCRRWTAKGKILQKQGNDKHGWWKETSSHPHIDPQSQSGVRQVSRRLSLPHLGTQWESVFRGACPCAGWHFKQRTWRLWMINDKMFL